MSEFYRDRQPCGSEVLIQGFRYCLCIHHTEERCGNNFKLMRTTSLVHQSLLMDKQTFPETPYIHVAEIQRRFYSKYRVVDKTLARLGKKQATATEDFDVHISYL
jgi:hypothetical protein